MSTRIRAKIELELYFNEHWTDKDIKELLEDGTMREILDCINDYEISKKEIIE